jgi:hypothetical protein
MQVNENHGLVDDNCVLEDDNRDLVDENSALTTKNDEMTKSHKRKFDEAELYHAEKKIKLEKSHVEEIRKMMLEKTHAEESHAQEISKLENSQSDENQVLCVENDNLSKRLAATKEALVSARETAKIITGGHREHRMRTTMVPKRKGRRDRLSVVRLNVKTGLFLVAFIKGKINYLPQRLARLEEICVHLGGDCSVIRQCMHEGNCKYRLGDVQSLMYNRGHPLQAMLLKNDTGELLPSTSKNVKDTTRVYIVRNEALFNGVCSSLDMKDLAGTPRTIEDMFKAQEIASDEHVLEVVEYLHCRFLASIRA